MGRQSEAHGRTNGRDINIQTLRGAEKVDHRQDMRLVHGRATMHHAPCEPTTLYYIGQILAADGAKFRA